MLAIKPKYFEDWLLENVLVFLLFPLIIWLDKKYKLSFLSIFFLLIFGIFHSIGAHFTYAEMEYFDFVTKFFGFERNHYDRVVHFLFGFLAFGVLFEIIFFHIKQVKASFLFTFCVIISISSLYEIIEWAAAVIFHPELGISFLGTQGDVWDAQKDTLAATFGAAIMLIIFWNTKVINKKNRPGHHSGVLPFIRSLRFIDASLSELNGNSIAYH